MTIGSNSIITMLVAIGPRLVGATFVYTAVIKAIAPHTFQNHLRSLGWIPFKWLPAAVTAAATFEAFWGTALIIGAAPAFFYPATILLLAGLTTISWWGVRSGKAKDCGCYGGYIQPSISQSMAINAAMILLLAAAMSFTSPTSGIGPWQTMLMIVAAMGVGGLAETAQRFERATGNLMFDTNPLKVGAHWKDKWADGATADTKGEVLVAYLGPNCPYCSQFVKVANAMVQSPSLPRVVGVMSAPAQQVSQYVHENAVRFPVVTVSQSLMGRLTRAVPTAVIVNGGKIEETWVGAMPPAIVDRFRDAFFPDAVKSAG